MKDKLLVKTKRPYKKMIRDELEKDATAEDVLIHLFGDRDGWIDSEYTVKCYEDIKTTALQRVNVIWVFPCYFMLIAPIKWVTTGEARLRRESRLARVIEFFLGDIS